MMHNKKKMNLRIALRRHDLVYDVANVAFITADAMPDAPARSHVQDAATDGNVDVVVRSLTRAHGELVHALSAYTAACTEHDLEVTTAPLPMEEYVLRLRVPPGFSAPVADAVAAAAHSYMVNTALADWFGITKKDEAELYAARAREELEKVKRYLNARVHPVRRKMSPW